MRVLHVLNGLSNGGAESVILNWYKNINRDEVQFDFLIRSNQYKNKDLILQMGGKIYETASFPKHFIKNYFETKKILETKQWNVIHIHANSAIYLSALVISKKLGYPCRIVHSHNSKTSNSLFKIIHLINKKYITSLSNYHFCCSKVAGEWMFTKDFQVIPNAIEVEKFRFDVDSRNKIRKEFNMEDKIVIGHTGRFVSAKNHEFILKIFSEIQKQNKNTVLFLVGDGELKHKIENQVIKMNLQDSVIFTGIRNDISTILSGLDLFLFPSFYEGLSVSLVEAQTNGLKCYVSREGVSDETNLTGNLEFLSLNESPEEWAKKILSDEKIIDRNSQCTKVIQAGFDIKTVTVFLENVYKMYD